jgi:hypothetical protein
MKALDAALDMFEVQFKTVTVATKGVYHGVSMGTDTILGERQIQDGRMTLKQLAMIEELVAAGMDRDVCIARFAEIKSEI